MNKARRKALQDIVETLEIIAGDEQCTFDNMPENIQESECGCVMEEGIANLDEAKTMLENIVEF